MHKLSFPLTERAPAKVNLTLRVLGRRTDGYHDLCSLVAFAGAHDLLTLMPDAPPALSMHGPYAQAAGSGEDNLVLRAARAFAQAFPGARLGAFTLLKRLPVAAGIGGGSSDAAAALRLLAQLNGVALDDPGLWQAAAGLGSDVPVCLTPTARWMEGRGERVGPAVALPPYPAVLVNPGVMVPTGAVFGGLAESLDVIPAEAGRVSSLLAFLAKEPNDLEAPALAIVPVIGKALEALRTLPACTLARMSGSGATVFGLFGSCHEAAAAAKTLRAARPAWWVKSTVLR